VVVGVDGEAAGFFRKLGSFALGFGAKKPESDCAPFGVVVETELGGVFERPAVPEKEPVTGELRLSFRTATLAPAAVTTAAFFIAGADDPMPDILGPDVALEEVVVASSFRFLGRTSGRMSELSRR